MIKRREILEGAYEYSLAYGPSSIEHDPMDQRMKKWEGGTEMPILY